jgi:SAM-dependent methyltransferase
MSRAEAFPIYFPGDARCVFGTDEATRRIARIAGWEKGSRVLDLVCGNGASTIFLAKEIGCQVVAADVDEKRLDGVRERVRAAGVHDRVEIRKVDLAQLSFPEEAFDGILVQGRVLFPFEEGARMLRRFLAPSGRLVLTYPVKVGRFGPKAPIEAWEARLGESLLLPRELLQVLEGNGYEPQSVETASDAELDETYRAAEGELKRSSGGGDAAQPFRDELELHKSQGGKASVSFALAIGRRKEPGERPPTSRDRG